MSRAPSHSAVRWALAAAIGAGALIAAVRAALVYHDRGLWLGVGAVAALALIQTYGLAALGLARLGLASEERGLGRAAEPSGRLWQERRSALATIAERGAAPNFDSLAAATNAAETGRAYLGRYLVAVAVLVGLVGTFAGLMETVRYVAPLLDDESTSVLAVVAGPLAGLDVTFGASIVGILVTLSLSLAHGDLVLAEERVLARLEERTRHELAPRLYPPAESTAARTLAELAALRAELGQILSASAQESAERSAAIAGEAARSIGATLERTVGGAVTAAGRELGAQVTAALAQVEAQSRAAQSAHEALSTRLGELVNELTRAVRSAATDTTTELARVSGAVGERLAELSAKTSYALEAVATAQAGRLDALATGTAERVSVLANESAERIGVLASESAAHVEAAALATTRGLCATSDRVSAQLHDLASATTVSMDRAFTGAAERLCDAVTQLSATVTTAADAQTRAVATVAADTAALVEGVGRRTSHALGELVTRFEAQLDAHADGLYLRLDDLGRSQASALARASAELVAAANSHVADHGAKLQGGAERLGLAATELGAGVSALTPALASLAPELGAIARELALVGGRLETADPQTLVLDELMRLGEGVTQLQSLVALAQDGDAASPPANSPPGRQVT
jgi:hypothetical protein